MYYPKAIVFDFDGTLVPSNQFKKNLYYKISEGKITKAAVKKIVDEGYGNYSRREILLSLCSKNNNELNFEEMMNSYENEYKNYLIQVEPMQGFQNLFDYLKETDCKLCINTANDENEMQSILFSKGWLDFFDLVLGSPRTKIENLRKIAESFSIGNEEICFVGDSEEDLQAAIASSVKFIGFSSPDSERLIGDYTEISDLSDLIVNLKISK